jgi:N-methylhydantoinase A
MTGYRIGIDIGGTFTDFTVQDERGTITAWKEESLADDPVGVIVTGLEAIADGLGLGVEELLGGASLLVHGSTIATNTVIQRSGPVTGLLCTRGFRDVVYFRDGYKWQRFNLHLNRPPDFVDRHLRIGVSERIDRAGEVLTALDETEVEAAAGRFRDAGVEAVAIAFLWSVMNPAHERRARAILERELPGCKIIISSEVLPEIREWERTSAAVLSAYVLPRIGAYLNEFARELSLRRLRNEPLIMQINGGSSSVPEIVRRPVYALHSGPAAAPAAAAYYGERIGASDLITVDMGGTSFDVSVIQAGRPAMSRSIQVEHQPIGVAGVEVHSIGAGGGSIAWLDSGGALRVGPRSAGSRPGPACYGLGGVEPTVTDANVVLGYLTPASFFGGRRRLDAERSEQSVATKIAEPLGLDVIRAAAGIVKVVGANMVAGIRAVSIERGIDPRSFTLICGGGAGGLHAAKLARQLGIRRVLVPREAGTFCAFGMTVTTVRHDYASSLHGFSAELDCASVASLYRELDGDAKVRLTRDGFDAEDVSLERFVDARYPNQVHELTIAVPGGDGFSPEQLAAVVSGFHDDHERRYGYAMREHPVEFLHWRVVAIGQLPAGRAAGRPSSNGHSVEPTACDERLAYSEALDRPVPTHVYPVAAFGPGASASGPAILEASDTTIAIDDGDTIRSLGNDGFVIDVGGLG